MTQKQRDVKRKLTVPEHARESGNVAKTARHVGTSRHPRPSQATLKFQRAHAV